MRRALLVVALIWTMSCGSERTLSTSPTSPTPTPPPQTWTLSGTTSETAPTRSTGVAGATVTIVDGPNAGRSATSDANGVFQLARLQPGSFTIRTRAADYVDVSQPITLTGDLTVAIELDPVFQIVTTTKNESLSGGGATCPGYWDVPLGTSPCSVGYLINVHHAGRLTAELTWTDRANYLEVDLFRSVNGRPSGRAVSLEPQAGASVDEHTQYVIQVSKFSSGGGPPPLGITTFTLTLRSPN